MDPAANGAAVEPFLETLSKALASEDPPWRRKRTVPGLNCWQLSWHVSWCLVFSSCNWDECATNAMFKFKAGHSWCKSKVLPKASTSSSGDWCEGRWQSKPAWIYFGVLLSVCVCLEVIRIKTARSHQNRNCHHMEFIVAKSGCFIAQQFGFAMWKLRDLDWTVMLLPWLLVFIYIVMRFLPLAGKLFLNAVNCCQG